ncbi:TatD family hydrolase [Gallibacterium sp. ZY190522]
MPFFDTHTHLDYLVQELNQSLSHLVAEAKAHQVEKMLVVGINRQSIDYLPNWLSDQPNLYYGVGLHPLFIATHKSQDLDYLEQHLAQQNKQCIAVAEIGLDRYPAEIITAEMWQKQCEFFDAQLNLANRYHLPVNLHSRRSHDQLYTFLKRHQLPKTGIVHGFSGSYEQAKRFVDLGYKIGVGGTITYPRANKTRQAIARLPLSALVLETDSPDMPIMGWQGQPNHPACLPLIFAELCKLRSENQENIAEQLWQSSVQLLLSEKHS